MTPKTPATFRIEDEIQDFLRQIKEEIGIPISEQVRRALIMWIEAHGHQVKSAPRRASTRRKA